MPAPDSYSLLPYATHELRRALTDAADAGYGGIELVEDHLVGLEPLGGPAALRRFADGAGLVVVAAGLGILREPDDAFSDLLGTSAAAGASSVIWVPPIRGYGDWSSMIDQAGELRRLASELGLEVWSHAPHGATLVETPEEIGRLLSEMPETRLCFDTGHYGLFDGDLAGGIRRFAGSIDHLHLRGLRRSGREVLGAYLPERKDWEIMLRLNADFTGPEEGVLDLLPAASVLADVGYRGWWSVEPPRKTGADRYASMRASLAAVRGLRQEDVE